MKPDSFFRIYFSTVQLFGAHGSSGNAGLSLAGAEEINLSPFMLADNETERRARYRAFVEQGVPEKELALMREALQRGQLTGNDRFGDEVEQILGRRIEPRRPGRPPSQMA